MDTDAHEDHTIITIQDIAISDDKTMVFIQEFTKMYNAVNKK